jgi:transcriptional regulator with XRE-family HTH domain
MSLVLRLREASGLTQAALAERAGTSRSRLSAYENGRTYPELDTLERIAAAADHEVALRPRGSGVVAERVGEIRRALVDGDSFWALRLVAELADWIRLGQVSVKALEADPGLTGDRHWDALVGGVVEMVCTEKGHPTPAWASAPSRVVDGWWFVTNVRSVWPSVFVATPAALAARGVFLSAESLQSV